MAQDIANFLTQQGAKNLNEMEAILTNSELMQTMFGIGEKTVLALQNFFSNPQTKALVEQLEQFGISFNAQLEEAKKETKESFSITGSFPFSREAIRACLQEDGYIFHENPTKQTEIMFIGENAGSKKKKAEEYGIQIFDDWEAMKEKFPCLGVFKAEIKKPSTPQNLASQTSLF